MIFSSGPLFFVELDEMCLRKSMLRVEFFFHFLFNGSGVVDVFLFNVLGVVVL